MHNLVLTKREIAKRMGTSYATITVTISREKIKHVGRVYNGMCYTNERLYDSVQVAKAVMSRRARNASPIQKAKRLKSLSMTGNKTVYEICEVTGFCVSYVHKIATKYMVPYVKKEEKKKGPPTHYFDSAIWIKAAMLVDRLPKSERMKKRRITK